MKKQTPPLPTPAAAAAEADAASRHSNVVGFFKKVWQHHDLSVKEQSAPQPSERAKTNTRTEAVDWHASLRGSPLLHSRRFFLVEYGIELLEDERTKREMHVSLLGYTSFVLIFLLYVFTNVPVADTFSTKRAIHRSVVHSKWTTANDDNKQHSLQYVESPQDVWNWLLDGFTNTNMYVCVVACNFFFFVYRFVLHFCCCLVHVLFCIQLTRFLLDFKHPPLPPPSFSSFSSFISSGPSTLVPFRPRNVLRNGI